jgi:hypothetical protein
MTAVLIVAFQPSSDASPACLLPVGGTSTLQRLVEQLARLGVERPRVLTRAPWREVVARRCPDVEVLAATDGDEVVRLVGAASGPEVLIAGEVVVNDVPLRGVLGATGSAALVGPAEDRDLESAPRCTVGRDRVLTTGLGDGPGALHRFLRVVRVAAPPAVLSSAGEDPILAVLDAALREGQHVRAVYLRDAVWAQADGPESATVAWERLVTRDEETLRLTAAVKAEDGWFTTHLVSPYSRYLARWAARRGMTPDQVTVASLAVGIGAAVAFATGDRLGMLVGALLLQAAFTLDCVDGQLARYAGSGTPFGGWLDAMFDRLKEFLVYAGLALGAVRVEADLGIWHLAAAALILQTVRHHVDLGYEADELDAWQACPPARAAAAEATAPSGPAGDRSPDPVGRSAPSPTVASRLVAAAKQVERSAPLRWLKRIVVLPIGERFALISVVAILGSARHVFLALLGWGSIALVYTATGRLARSAR